MTAKQVHVTFMVGSLRMGGAERMMIHTANELSKHLQVTFLSLTGGTDLVSELNNSVRLISFEKKKSLAAFASVCKFLRLEKPDVLISTQIHVNLIAVLLKLCCRTRTRIILREATSPGSQFAVFTDARSRLVKLAVKLLYPKADRIVAICEAVKENLLAHRFAKPGQVSVIYNPVVNDGFRMRSNEYADHEFFHAGVPVLISVGRLAPAKNFSLLVRSFAKLNKDLDSRLILIGDGPDKEKLISLADRLGLAEKISFTGQVANPYPFLKKSGVYVLTSLFEGLPNALIEAMACGVQLVSVDCPGGSREVLMDGRLGKLVRMNDENALAAAIAGILVQPVDKSSLLDGAKRFESSITADGYLALINQLIR